MGIQLNLKIIVQYYMNEHEMKIIAKMHFFNRTILSCLLFQGIRGFAVDVGKLESIIREKLN